MSNEQHRSQNLRWNARADAIRRRQSHEEKGSPPPREPNKTKRKPPKYINPVTQPELDEPYIGTKCHAHCGCKGTEPLRRMPPP